MNHHTMTRKEHIGLLLFAAFAQSVIAAGLIVANVASAAVWGTWFVGSAIAAVWFAFCPESEKALGASAVGIVCGTVARGSWLLITIEGEQHKGLILARATLYLLVGLLAFFVWVRLLAPNNGVARAEDKSVVQ